MMSHEGTRMHTNNRGGFIRVHSCPFVAQTIFFKSPDKVAGEAP